MIHETKKTIICSVCEDKTRRYVVEMEKIICVACAKSIYQKLTPELRMYPSEGKEKEKQTIRKG